MTDASPKGEPSSSTKSDIRDPGLSFPHLIPPATFRQLLFNSLDIAPIATALQPIVQPSLSKKTPQMGSVDDMALSRPDFKICGLFSGEELLPASYWLNKLEWELAGDSETPIPVRRVLKTASMLFTGSVKL